MEGESSGTNANREPDAPSRWPWWLRWLQKAACILAGVCEYIKPML